MIVPGTLALRGTRTTPLAFRILFRGIDLTGAALAGTVRQEYDNPVSSITLPGGVGAGVTGLRLISVAVVDSVPNSLVELFITKTNMEGIGAAEELGEDLEWRWWMNVTPSGGTLARYLEGAFVVGGAGAGEGAGSGHAYDAIAEVIDATVTVIMGSGPLAEASLVAIGEAAAEAQTEIGETTSEAIADIHDAADAEMADIGEAGDAKVAAIAAAGAAALAAIANAGVLEASIGYPGEIPDGTNTLPGITCYFGTSMPAGGVVKNFRVYVPGARDIDLFAATRAWNGSTWDWTRQRTVEVTAGDDGYLSLENDLAFMAGEHLGCYADGLRYSAGPGDERSYFYIGGDSGDGVGTEITDIRLHLGFDVKFATDDDRFSDHVVHLGNVDKITVVGDSHSAGQDQLRWKSWAQKASMWSDYNWENFSQSGDTMPQVLTRIRDRTPKYDDRLSFCDYGSSWAVVMLAQNDSSSISHDTFQNVNLRNLVETVRDLGAKPIIANEFGNFYGTGSMSMTIRQAAEQLGAVFLDVRESALLFDAGAPTTAVTAFKDGQGHYGTRMNEVIAAPAIDMARSLPRPRRGLKLFNLRGAMSVGSIADLMFDNERARNTLFRELAIGHTGLSEATANYYDDIRNGSAVLDHVYPSQYLKLQSGEPLEMAEYALAEVIIDAEAPNVASFGFHVSDPDVEVWIRDVSLAAFPSAGAPLGVWRPLDVIDNWVWIHGVALRGVISTDKLTLLLHKSGGFDLQFPTPEQCVRYRAIPGKALAPALRRMSPRGSELLSQPLVVASGALAAGWTGTGSPAIVGPLTGESMPLGTTGWAEITSSAKITQTVSFAADNMKSRECEIEIWARHFPAIFASGGSYPAAAPVHEDSVDFRTLIAELTPTGVSSSDVTVETRDWAGLWTRRIRFRTLIELGVAGFTLTLKAESGTIQVARASAKFVD